MRRRDNRCTHKQTTTTTKTIITKTLRAAVSSIELTTSTNNNATNWRKANTQWRQRRRWRHISVVRHSALWSMKSNDLSVMQTNEAVQFGTFTTTKSHHNDIRDCLSVVSDANENEDVLQSKRLRLRSRTIWNEVEWSVKERRTTCEADHKKRARGYPELKKHMTCHEIDCFRSRYSMTNNGVNVATETRPQHCWFH